RKKGLIWYPTYVCDFDGAYTIKNEEKVAQKVRVHFDFPNRDGTYDDFGMFVDGERVAATVNTREGLGEIVELAPGQSAEFQVIYRTRGIRDWRYAMDPNVGRVQGLNLAVATDFKDVDYPEGCLSPMSAEEADGGMRLTWAATDLITREGIGVIIPEKLNPGPLTSRITFFAPVCLVFFFVLVATINILYKVNIHPMHYLFVAAGFFAFHLLLAYMAGHVHIHLAFAISAVVSVTLVTSYLSGALRGGFPWKVAAAGQLFFLVLFSYTFFLEGITGLAVAIGSVVTLAVLM
ncbi:MAG: cell envelope integrity protein CreD, partial [bacterium]|nr:cell envelope integrity protein CreD [bacterium]